MPIGNAVQRGDYIYVYDTRGRQIFSLPASSADLDGLCGFTGGSVSIRRGDYIYTYDDAGRQISSIPAR